MRYINHIIQMSTMTETTTDQTIQTENTEIRQDNTPVRIERNRQGLPTVELEIVERKGRKYMLRDSRNLQIELDKSLLIDANGIKVNLHKKRLQMPAGLYNIWFGQAEKRQRFERERRQRELIGENVPLLWRNRKRILDDKRLFFAMIPVSVGMLTLSGKDAQIPLGILVRAWDEYGDTYTRECPQCGGKMLVWNFGGIPLSGTSVHSDVCTECGYKRNNVKENSLRDMSDTIISISRQYQEESCPDAMMLEDVIEQLKRADTDL